MNTFRYFRSSFLKNEITNLLSIGGLSLGIAIALVLGWWVFGLAGVIAVLIALTTVSWQTYMTARRNPVESLRYE